MLGGIGKRSRMWPWRGLVAVSIVSAAARGDHVDWLMKSPGAAAD